MEVTLIDEERQRFARRLRERDAEIELLRALLREPTPEMLDAAEQYNREHITGEWSFADCYRAMTSRALEPKE